MVYPSKIEQKLGFDGVRAMVSRACATEGSRALCRDMAFMSDPADVRAALARTSEMLAAQRGDSPVPLEGFDDIDQLLATVRVPGTFLTEAELVRVRKVIGCIAAVAAYFAAHRDDCPALAQMCRDMEPFPTAAATIDKVIDETGQVRDSASPELGELRRRLRSMAGRINSIIRQVMARAAAEGLIDADTTPAVRDGRLVIPVSPMNKRRINGIVHDESASGKTVFIEPAEVVEASNLTRELEIDERREVVRILTAVTDELRVHIDPLLAACGTLARLDFIRAKAKVAADTGGMMPVLSDAPEMEWYHACHPVLQKSLEKQGKEIVPIDITLTPEKRILVISGPNAGGKSVVLKTVGTLQYMLQCGMLPPLYENSRAGVFQDLMVDIGDDQSIEDDLSTYSSHLRNMKLMVGRGRGTSLVLIDEFGGGTEPQIGGAIAQAILRRLNELKMWGVVTTHFQNLKHFADDAEGLVNGSMLYDRQLMRPLFRLSIGNPGSSFAIEIARKTGLPTDIIDEASQIVGSDYVNLDNYLMDITRDKRYWENKRTSIRQKEKKLDELLARYGDDAETLRLKRREIIEEARAEARRIIEQSNSAVERTIHDIKAAAAEKERTQEARRKLRDERLALEKEKAPENALLKKAPKKRDNPGAAPAAKKELKAGDNVKLDGGNTVGTIMEIQGRQATVSFNSIKTTVKLDRLTPTLKKPDAPRGSAMTGADTSRARQLGFKQEIDVRGMRLDEALQAVTYFIDDAIQFQAGRVRILHGTGTGALRQGIRQQLAVTPGVRQARDEDVRFGGAGVTVVELD